MNQNIQKKIQIQKMKRKNIEIRSFQTELQAGEGRLISGLAIPVNSRSQLLYDKDKSGKEIWYYETITPLAVNESLIQNNDVQIFLNHDEHQGTFARSKYGVGTLHLEITERGLEFSFEAPNTVNGDILIEGIKRGDYDAVSFAFVSNPMKEVVEPNEEDAGTFNRTINEIVWLGELSVLSCSPAYLETGVNVRSIDEYLETKRNSILSTLDEKMKEFED